MYNTHHNTKNWLAAIFVIMLVFGLPACGGSEDAPAAESPPEAAQSQVSLATNTPEATATPVPPTVTPTPSAEDHFKQGEVYRNQGELAKALTEYQAAVELEPDNPQAHNDLGAILIDLGQSDDAMAELKKAISLDPEYAAAHSNLCGAHTMQANYNEALAECDKAVKLDPTYANTYNNLGFIYLNQNNVDGAVDAFKKTIQLDPEHFWAHNNLGLIYSNQGNFKEATALLEEATRINPYKAKGHYNLGLTFARQNEYEKAIAEYKETIKLDPNYIDAHIDLGIVYRAMDMPDKAIPEYETVLKLDPNQANPHLELGLIYRDQGIPDKAVTEFETYLQLKPDSPKRADVEAELAKLQTPTIERLLQSPPAPDIVADFTTYTGKNGVSFQYPANWQVDEQDNNSVVIGSNADMLDGLQKGEIGVQVRINATTLQEWGVSGPMEGLNRFIGSMSDDMILDGPAEIQINGQPAVAVLLRLAEAKAPQSSVMAIIQQGDNLTVAAAVAPLELEAQLFPTMAAIVSSVQMGGSQQADTDATAELPPGNTISFSEVVPANGHSSYFFLGEAGSSIIASIEPAAGLAVAVELQDMQTGNVLATAKESNGRQSLVYKIPENGSFIHKLVVQNIGGAKGKYKGTFVGTAGIGFDLLPSYLVAARMPQGRPLRYMYTGKAGSTLNLLAAPVATQPGAPIDPVIKISNLTDIQTVLQQTNNAGPGEEEKAAFTLPADGIYFIAIQDAGGNAGNYLLAVKAE